MGLRYNPFNGSFDFTRSPGSYLDGEVATFADLPLSAAAPLNSAWLVRAGSGLWLLTRKPAGIYIRTATGGTDRNADYTYASAFPDVFSDANFTVYDDANSARSMQIQVSDNETLTFKVTGTDSVVRSVAFPLSAILLAAVMFASSALAQNIGIVTGTNGTVITGRTNPLTFTNPATFSGTLTATGNVTMSGTANTAPLQTASSGSSLMTRELSDDRYRLFYVPLVQAVNQTAANGSTWNLRPFHSADAMFSVPSWARNVRVYLSTGFTNAPVSNNFTAVVTAYAITSTNASFGTPHSSTTNAFSATSVFNNGSNLHKFIFGMTNDIALSPVGIADAESAGFWNILMQVRNDSSASLTTVPDNWLRGMAVFTD
jgi:hypothetical protein